MNAVQRAWRAFRGQTASAPVAEAAPAPPAPLADAPYRAPLFLLRPPADPAVPFRFELPTLAAPMSQLCTANQFEEPLYGTLCYSLAITPDRHRKYWEYAYILRVLEVAGVLRPGNRALGFGTGREPLPSVLARHGVEVVATDAPPDVNDVQGWASTNQYSAQVLDLHRPEILPQETFLKHVTFRPADMNAIPDDLRDFDACWSSCCFEHLGSLRHGLDFVENSLKCLRPGGIAVHTTEFNLDSNDETFESLGLSIYRKRDLEGLCARLSAEGHDVWPLNTHPGYSEVDQIIDLPPFARALPHLKVGVVNTVATSVGIVVRRRA